jgi:DNA-binding GntR family transcriptional regulator
MSEALVDTLLSQIRAMTIDFRLKPGERINEGALSAQLKASRTPLREALNRLVAEGFLTAEAGRGFFCRSYGIAEVHNLYQLRQAIERFAASLVAADPPAQALAELEAFLDRTADGASMSLEDRLACDEYFHETLAGLAGNGELLRALKIINARISFFRWVDLGHRRSRTQAEHRVILARIAAGEGEAASRLIDDHISRRRDEIASALKECHARIFLDEDFVAPSFRSLEAQ